jgi:hypothetical protein
MKAVILISVWVSFLALTMCAVFSNYKSVAMTASLPYPPLGVFLFVGTILNTVTTASVLWRHHSRTGRAAVAVLVALTLAFWIFAWVTVVFFVLGLAGSLSRTPELRTKRNTRGIGVMSLFLSFGARRFHRMRTLSVVLPLRRIKP